MGRLPKKVEEQLQRGTDEGVRDAIKLYQKSLKHDSEIIELPAPSEGIFNYELNGRCYRMKQRAGKKAGHSLHCCTMSRSTLSRFTCPTNFIAFDLEMGGKIGFFSNTNHNHAGLKYQSDDYDEAGCVKRLVELIEAVKRGDVNTVEAYRQVKREVDELIRQKDEEDEGGAPRQRVYVKFKGDGKAAMRTIDYVGRTELTLKERFNAHSATKNLHSFTYDGSLPRFRARSSKLVSPWKAILLELSIYRLLEFSNKLLNRVAPSRSFQEGLSASDEQMWAAADLLNIVEEGDEEVVDWTHLLAAERNSSELATPTIDQKTFKRPRDEASDEWAKELAKKVAKLNEGPMKRFESELQREKRGRRSL